MAAGLPDAGFRRGLTLGLLLAALLVVFAAAGRLSHDPDKALAALLAAGAPVDPRLVRAAPVARRNLLCAALAVVLEARGEPDAGQVAVAWVVRTRAHERSLDACGVVFEPHQFEWASWPLRKIVRAVANNAETFLEAQEHAWAALVEDARDPSRGANHFWSPANMRRAPAWARMAAPGSRVSIGGHVFIRIPHRRAAWAFGERARGVP